MESRHVCAGNAQMNKVEKARQHKMKKTLCMADHRREHQKTQELFRCVQRILNQLKSPWMFDQLMMQAAELPIDTEERLKGVIDLIFEKAISEPHYSSTYANLCRGLMGLNVPSKNMPETTLNFRCLLLNRCQCEFERDKDNDEIIDKKRKELTAASNNEQSRRLVNELKEARDKAHTRSLGNIKFISELFKVKMLSEAIVHDCIVKLFKDKDSKSLERLCLLLTNIGKDLDFEKAKPRMNQYFDEMENIKKEWTRICSVLQDVLDLRQNNWVKRRHDQGPKAAAQTHRAQEPGASGGLMGGASVQDVEFPLEAESEKSEMSMFELTKQLDRLIQDQADNQKIFDWIQTNLDEKQTLSNMFVRALMTCICQSAITRSPYKVNANVIKQRAKLLLKFLKDEQKELQALYALQALMVRMEQPPHLLRMFFDALYDEDIIKEEALYKWESSKDPSELTGKGVALKSVTAFFTWLREAEYDSDHS